MTTYTIINANGAAVDNFNGAGDDLTVDQIATGAADTAIGDTLGLGSAGVFYCKDLPSATVKKRLCRILIQEALAGTNVDPSTDAKRSVLKSKRGKDEMEAISDWLFSE